MSEKSKRLSTNSSDDETAGKQLSLPIHEEKVTAMPTTIDKGKDFEATLSELETIVQQLEGEVKLEDALRLFDRGVQLSQHCEEFLKTAEQKIEILKKAVNGTLSSEKFNEEILQNS